MEIERCPFCGELVTITYNTYSDTFNFACPSCHLHAWFGYTSATVHYGSKQRAEAEAVKRWNKRSNLPTSAKC